jgi:hypothetical protein
MWIYPFKTIYLKSSLSREEIKSKMLELVFLSDENYQRSDELKKFFYGTLSNEDFDFQSLDTDNRLTPYAAGYFRGADNEMYIFLHLKGFKSRRLFLVLFAAILIMTGIAITEIVKYGAGVFLNPPFEILLLMLLFLGIFTIRRGQKFKALAENSLRFFRGLLNAEVVRFKDVPIVFRL